MHDDIVEVNQNPGAALLTFTGADLVVLFFRFLDQVISE